MENNKPKLKVSVIIVNYHSSKLINDCLETIREKTKDISYEVIIVDNATEKLSEVIKDNGIERMKFLELPSNVGFGRANNKGAELAEGEYLFFLNPDTLLLNDAINILSGFMDSTPDCGVCGGNLYDVDLRPNISFRRIMPGIGFELNEIFHLMPERLIYKDNRLFNHTERPIKVSHISGADLMMRKDLFTAIGGFSPEFFMYYEETDLCNRVRRAHYHLYSVPSARIIHLEGGTFKVSQSESKIKMTEEGRIIYFRRNHSRLHNLAGHFLHRMFLLSRIILTEDAEKKENFRLRLKWCNKLLES